MFPSLKLTHAVALLVVAWSSGNAVEAQERPASFPARPIRLVIPWPAGGPSDIVGRVFAEPLAKVLGETLVIDNRGGASGSIGAELVAKAPADGYTLMVQSMTNQLMFAATVKNLRFDPITDFEPITQITYSAMIVVANASLSVTNMAELVSLARAKPGALSIASFGQGSVSHLGIELLMKLASINVVHIPYKGGAPAVVDTAAGHTPVAILGLPVTLPYIKQGRLRALGVTTAVRAPQLPDTPSISETSGLGAYDLGITYGFLAPAKTPANIIARLHASAAEVLQRPEFAQKMLDLGLGRPIGNSPAAMAAATRREMDMLVNLAKSAGIQPE
jgi:tripartite-type tricarboxylate transporter receptor subunit TctC